MSPVEPPKVTPPSVGSRDDVALESRSEILDLADWPSDEPRRRRVRKRLYIMLFILMTAFLSLDDETVRVTHASDVGLLRVERLTGSSGFRLYPPLPGEDTKRAEQLGVSTSDLYTAERVLNKYFELRESSIPGPLDWGITIPLRDYTIVVSYKIFLNMFISGIISFSVYIWARDRVASRLIDSQNKQLLELNEELERKVDEAQRYLAELESAQEKLVQAQKLASVGRMSATLAHEIRNPLSIIQSAAGMAAEDVPPGSPPAESINLIRQEIRRLDQIITELLNFARPKPPRIETHDVNSLLKGWVHPLKEELEKAGVALKVELAEDLRPILADADQLYQVFLNIIWNARDAAREMTRGEIVVTTRPAENRRVCIDIRDNGEGMDKETLAQIYEPFFTTKTSGSGLGLPVVRQLMEGMGGEVVIESQLERGTAVYLNLRTGKQ